MTWYCIATKRDEERRTANELARHGFPVWLPEEFRYRLPRKTAPARSWYIPVLSQVLFAADPIAMTGIRLWRDVGEAPIPVPWDQIERFKIEIEARNILLQRHFRQLLAGRKSKKPERYKGFDELRAALERKSTMEIAA